jgi:hypothetical protein
MMPVQFCSPGVQGVLGSGSFLSFLPPRTGSSSELDCPKRGMDTGSSQREGWHDILVLLNNPMTAERESRV